MISEQIEEPVDRLLDVGGNLYKFQFVSKFQQALPFDVHKDSGLICIHPISGIIAHYEYATDRIGFYRLDGSLEKSINLARSMSSFQWMSNGEDEKLLCYFSDYFAISIDYATLETVSYGLEPIFANVRGKEFVISATTLQNNRLWAIMSTGELLQFFGWKSDGSCQVLIWETGIRFCVELCVVNEERLYGYNREYLYSIQLKEKAVVCKFIESVSLISPIYISICNANLFAVVFADRNPNLCQLKVYDAERACISYSLKLDYLPLAVRFLCNNSFLIVSSASVTLVNNETFREEQFFEPIFVFQFQAKQCFILTATGMENVTFCSRQVEHLKVLLQQQLPFTASDIGHSCENVETILEIALLEWNPREQNASIQVASHLSCYLASGEIQKEKLEKAIRFIRFVNSLRTKYKIGCLFITQTDFHCLARILIRLELFEKAFGLCKIFPTSQLKEEAFFGWLRKRHSQEQLSLCRRIQQEMSISNEKLIQFCLESSPEMKEFMSKFVTSMNDIQLFCRSIKHHSLSDVQNVLTQLSNEEKVHSIYLVLEKFLPLIGGHSVGLPEFFEILSQNSDISRYFQDFCLYRLESFRELLCKFYYSLDANILLKDVECLQLKKSFSLREMEKQTLKLHSFQEELAISLQNPLILNMSLLETRSLLSSSSSSQTTESTGQVLRLFTATFLFPFTFQ